MRYENKKSRNTKCAAYKRFILKFDIYKEPLKLQLPDKSNQYRTFCGSLLSFFTISVLLFYVGFKM